MQYRKKPVVIDAEQFVVTDGTDVSDGKKMFMSWPIQKDGNGYFVIIETLEGNHRASNGDYIITGILGEQYPCKPDIFKQTYEKVK